ncbi:MAG: sulfatase [Spirochaetes bacterium]|nr:sulfatase [Spirochaetota bacterium]
MAPNLIFMLVDDLGWRDLSCTGSTFYETPNIDRLAKAGMRFTRAYAACPVCSPSRASILTGKYPVRVGITDYINWGRDGSDAHGHAKGYLVDAPYADHLPLEEVSLARALQEGDYQTWHVGKWHLGREPYHPEHHGFETNIGGCMVGCPIGPGYFSPWGIPALEGVTVPPGTHLDEYLTGEACRLIRQRDPARPFFLNLWFYLVHTPLQERPERIAKYEAKRKAMGLDGLEETREGDFFPCDHKKGQRITRRLVQSHPVYAAMVETLDDCVGRVLKTLEEEGILENSVLVFTSDNGGLATAEGSPTCNLPLAEGKGWRQEGGVREPLLISWPGRVVPGSVCETPITSPDFYPTFLEAAGLPLRPEQHVDGQSLVPLLTQQGSLSRDALYWHYPHYGNQGGTPGAAILVGRYKLLEHFEDGRVELFDLESDPAESVDLSKLEPTLTAKLKARLDAWKNEVGARHPTVNKAFTPWSEAHARKGWKPWV